MVRFRDEQTYNQWCGIVKAVSKQVSTLPVCSRLQMAAAFRRLLVVAKRSAYEVYVGMHGDAHLKTLLQEKSQVGAEGLVPLEILPTCLT